MIKFRTKWILAAWALAWAATCGVAITYAGSPSKKPSSVDIQAVIKSADAAAKSGDFFEALRLYRQAAEKGDARAQSKVGVMYLDSDPNEALKWLKLAAAQGYAEAEFRLGSMYEHGDAVPRDKNEATKWYQLAASQGYKEAQYALGIMTRPAAPAKAFVPTPQRTSPADQRAQIIARYEQCNSNARDRYKADWDDNCERVHKRELDNYYTCLEEHQGTQYNSDPWGCARVYRTDTESRDCKLPLMLADSLKHDFERAQNMCTRAYGLH